MAYGIQPAHNGRLLQNLILAANYLHSHIVHFYQLSALDFVDVKAVLQYKGKDHLLLNLKQWIEDALARKDVFPAAPFLPRYEVNYIKDLDINVSLVAHYVQALEAPRSPTKWRPYSRAAFRIRRPSCPAASPRRRP